LQQHKRTIYIALFIILGVLLSFLIHGSAEIWYTNRLISDFPRYSLGYTWAQWFVIHRYASIILLILGVVFGYFQGRSWWRLVYDEKRFDPFFRKLRKFLYG
jgi:hypothetical protein